MAVLPQNPTFGVKDGPRCSRAVSNVHVLVWTFAFYKCPPRREVSHFAELVDKSAVLRCQRVPGGNILGTKEKNTKASECDLCDLATFYEGYLCVTGCGQQHVIASYMAPPVAAGAYGSGRPVCASYNAKLTNYHRR